MENNNAKITETDINPCLWSPDQSRIDSAQLTKFMQHIETTYGQSFNGSYDAIHSWSVENISEFWSEVWDFCNVIGEKGEIALEHGEQFPTYDKPSAAFFPQAQINFAENLLRRDDDATAIIFRDEHKKERQLSYKDLHTQVSLWQQAFKNSGVKKGDRIAALMPNTPDTIIAMLAATSLGATWSSASPDFGVQGVLDRFGQIEPTIFIAIEGYYYNGKTVNCLPKIKDIQAALTSTKTTVVIPFANPEFSLSGFDSDKTIARDDFLADYQAAPITYERVEFNHPLYILFSSGTTGVPKCIVHGHGGTLLQHLKEYTLHCDIARDDPVFYYTTCGWMMWNWLVTALAVEAQLLLYDGSPFYPDGYTLWDFTTAHNCKLFGTAAKYIDALKNAEVHPKDKYDLSTIKILTSTGSPLVHESFDFIYEHVKQDLHVASITGGTDIVSLFMGGNPISPVFRGEIQGACLGMDMDIYDHNGNSSPVHIGGELVCKKPFPCMPVMFWNDPDHTRYHSAYFDSFNNTWTHGDYTEKTTHSGYIIHGRSDATLNPGGVRIGTAEIYRQVEKIDGVLESIAVGQDWDGDQRVILFVILDDKTELTEELEKEVKVQIRSGASPRHVPAKIVQVTDIPRTKSGKMTEIAVRDIIHGRTIKNKEALANPEALELYRNIDALQS